MKFTTFPLNYTTLTLFMILPYVLTQSCKKTCGNIPIKYPFGTGPGCGDPRFQSYVNCNQEEQLTFITHKGCYPITSIDYNNQILYINDPSMSTCSCSQPSKGFSLDWNSPFSFHDNTIFALLDCSISSSSPIYGGGNNNNSSSYYNLCDQHGGEICNFLYSCSAISTKISSSPVSTCCVYTPVNLGPSFEMDLEKLGCSSYSGLYGFNGQETNPSVWKYGVALKYKFNYDNDYPSICANCEKTNGVCGYNVGGSNSYASFSCNCPNGFNSSDECFSGVYWSYGSRIFPWPQKTGAFLICYLARIAYEVLFML
ncbi:hypothetical protein M9H77_10061 [Catharanthus roseus]|uniref:Uncharacterized protein n=1 Tax=Catharanthus roseus TaxID=4058 RepID=A0ACC0C2E6_CATRO|nr:hypothetical protein M9H77_10061 [Catharanthus roseus]